MHFKFQKVHFFCSVIRRIFKFFNVKETKNRLILKTILLGYINNWFYYLYFILNVFKKLNL